MEYIAPEIQLSCLHLGVFSLRVEQLIAELDEQGLTSHYKVGIMYCRAGQSTEEEMYNNENAGPAFIEFLGCIGITVRLQGFSKYRAGLDNKCKYSINNIQERNFKLSKYLQIVRLKYNNAMFM